MDRAILKQEIENVGIRATAQRVLILEYLREHHIHPTAEMIYKSLCKEHPSLSLTTVYSTLKLFTSNGLVQMLTIDEKMQCFDGEIKPHTHFYCKNCGTIYDFPVIDSQTMTSIFPKNFTIDEMHLYLKGICNNCTHINS